jgi:hypothetical protein
VNPEDLYYDSDRNPVPAVEPIYFDDPPAQEIGNRLDVSQILSILLIDDDPNNIRERTLVLAYFQQQEDDVARAPESLRELAQRLGCSKSGVEYKLNKLRTQIGDILGY